MKAFNLVIIFQLFFFIGFGQNFKVGDKVEIYNSGAWYKGSILQIGTESYQGYYSVSYDGYSNPQWMKASNIRLQNATSNTADRIKPRNGNYIILSYGSPTNPIRIGYFELNNSKYTYYSLGKKNLGQGSFTFDVQSKTIKWLDGPFKDAQWGGAFETAREGKTHKIRLNRVTIGSNSSDSN